MATTLAAWTIDPVQSSVEFSLDYMGFSTYRTGFRALEGSLEFDAARPAASSVDASIPVASVDVTNDRLMSRLMDPDLLGGRDHPTITFKSTRVEVLDPAHWRVTGDLTIHGVAQPVVLDTRYLGQAKHPFSGKIAAAFRAETAIDRRDFGVTWNAAMDTGAAYLGERVSTRRVRCVPTKGTVAHEARLSRLALPARGSDAFVRASVHDYNDEPEVERFVRAVAG
jgi:polyisoprenoid-binding protein YceI